MPDCRRASEPATSTMLIVTGAFGFGAAALDESPGVVVVLDALGLLHPVTASDKQPRAVKTHAEARDLLVRGSRSLGACFEPTPATNSFIGSPPLSLFAAI